MPFSSLALTRGWSWRIHAATPRGVHEHAQHIPALPQHIVTAAAQDHAGAFLGQLLDDAALQNEHLIAQRQLVAHGVQAVQQAVGVPFSLAATASSDKPECFAAMVISSLS